MTSIIRAGEKDISLLADIGRLSFIESHGSSAAAEDIDEYVNNNYTYDAFIHELSNPEKIYHVIYYEDRPAGYSEIVFNDPHPDSKQKNVAKLNRLYMLKEFYSMKLGYELFRFNVDLSKKNEQSGMWLYVWKENHRAVDFYEKAGFKIIGSHNFRISDKHSNPNHRMLLIF
ncbi:MAG: GNAT family N-acetyltransferase [bacterium]|nr:GNAT family N-acetyltransferase [bacterium]